MLKWDCRSLDEKREREREKGETWKYDSLASRLRWESGYLGCSSESALKIAVSGILGVPYWTEAFRTDSQMWSLQPSYQVGAIFIPPPFHRWGSWHSRTLNSTAGEKTSWNLNTNFWSLHPNPFITPPCLPPLLCGNPFCSLLVRICLVSGDRNPIQISLMTAVLEGHCDRDQEGKRSASPQGWGELRELRDVRIMSFLCASLCCGYILS